MNRSSVRFTLIAWTTNRNFSKEKGLPSGSLFVFIYPENEKLYNKSYFEAGRSPRKRSLLEVNEHFEDKPDAKRAFLFGF